MSEKEFFSGDEIRRKKDGLSLSFIPEGLQAVTIDSKAFEKIIQKYPAVSKKELEDWAFSKCEYYSKQNQEKLETLGFEKGKKKEWNDKIKDFVLLVDMGWKKKEHIPTDMNVLTRRGQIETFWIEQPFFYDRSKIFWLWNKEETRWELSDETDFLNSIQRQLGIETIDGKNKTELIEGFRQIGRLHIPKPIKESWIQFKDTIYDINKNVSFPATPEHFVTNPIPYNLGKEEETPEIDKLFSSWVSDDDKKILYEMLAFCLAPKYFIHRIFCLIGSGSNGKSTFLKILTKFIGQNNITASSLNLIIKERFEGSKLLNKLVCLMGETNFNLITNTSFLKNLTGEDLVRCEFKGKDVFDFENYAKLIMATNSLPPTADRTDGYYRRWKIIDFSNKFTKEKDVFSEIPKEEYNNLALKCLNILKRLWKDRKFSGDVSFEERRKEYEEKANPLMKFLEENYEQDINKEVFFADFFKGARDYLKEKGLREISAIAISKQLKNEGFEIKTLQREQNGRYILGITTKDEPYEPYEPLSHSNLHVEISKKKVHMVQKVNTQKELENVEVQKF